MRWKKEKGEKEIIEKRKKPLLIWGSILIFFIFLLLLIKGAVLLLPEQAYQPEKHWKNYGTEDLKDSVIHEYVSHTEHILKSITVQLNKVSDQTTFEGLSAKDLADIQQTIKKLENEVKTNVNYLMPLQDYYVKEIELGQNIIGKVIEHKENESMIHSFQVNAIREEYNDNVKKEQKIIMALFDKAGIHYELKEDGSLYYEILEKEK